MCNIVRAVISGTVYPRRKGDIRLGEAGQWPEVSSVTRFRHPASADVRVTYYLERIRGAALHVCVLLHDVSGGERHGLAKLASV